MQICTILQAPQDLCTSAPLQAERDAESDSERDAEVAIRPVLRLGQDGQGIGNFLRQRGFQLRVHP